jgi:hypothetical protein
MTPKPLLLSLLLASAIGLSCEKEVPNVVQAKDPNAVLDARLADITGIYHGTIRHWIVNGQAVPGDTIWNIYPGYFVLRTSRGVNDSWAIIVNSDSLSAEGGYLYNQPDNPGGNPVSFLYPIRVDPVYGFSDGKRGGLTVWRSPRKAEGRFSHDPGPGRYGVYYEGYKK